MVSRVRVGAGPGAWACPGLGRLRELAGGVETRGRGKRDGIYLLISRISGGLQGAD